MCAKKRGSSAPPPVCLSFFFALAHTRKLLSLKGTLYISGSYSNTITFLDKNILVYKKQNGRNIEVIGKY